MTRILIPTDFSANAQRATGYAVALFGNEADYSLLHTYDVPHSGATVLISIADILKEEAQKQLETERKRLLAEFPILSGRLEVLTDFGQPDAVIRKLVDSDEFDMVIMGTKGASGLKGVLVGSVASNTMQNVRCPVLAVPVDARTHVPKRILFAVDDALLSDGVFPKELASLVKKFNAELMVLNVVPEGEGEHAGYREGNERVPTTVFDDVNHSLHFVESSNVFQAIDRFVQENDVDMIAMVSRRDDLFGKLFGLSMTKQMMMHTEIPLAAFH